MSKYGNSKIGYKINDDYYTPKFIFEKLNTTFDLDVCSPENGVDWIPANKHFSVKDDGLKQEWFGNVWCNPPYSSPALWMDKFLTHKNGIGLVGISNSKWFNKVWNEVDGLVFMHPKVKFEHKTEGTKVIFMPVVLIAIGESNVKAISHLGKIR